MRPLYIHGVAGTQVSLEEPALTVSMPGKADQLFPLARVSRVVVSGSVDWRTEALLACAANGITITFIDNEGGLLARCLGKDGERQAMLQRLADLLGKADGLKLYGDWYQAMQRMAVQSTARRLLKNKQIAVTASELSDFFITQREGLLLAPLEPVYRQLHGLLLADVLAILHQQGLDASSELLQEKWLNLPADFTELLFWDWQIPLLLWLEDQATVPNHEQCVAFYQERAERTARLCQGLLNKLHRWLIELY